MVKTQSLYLTSAWNVTDTKTPGQNYHS